MKSPNLKHNLSSRHGESGIVSMLTVLFMSVLVTIVALGFIKLMLGDQQQATSQDLSRSAYDSAQAGAEDAKRLLLMDQACTNGERSGSECSLIASGIAGQQCDTLSNPYRLVSRNEGETLVQQVSGSAAAAYNQAYTCVKINKNLDDYIGVLNKDEGSVVPLSAQGSYDRVEISWFNYDDLSNKDVPQLGLWNKDTLPTGSAWKVDSRRDSPAMMRAQILRGTGSNYSSLSSGDPAGGSDNAAAFMYPATSAESEVLLGRRDPMASPKAARCSTIAQLGGFACRQVVKLPSDATAGPGQVFYLNLIGLYSGPTHFKVRLLSGSSDANTTPVRFAGVQAEIDSTGRANNYFRRIASRVELTGQMKYPISVADIDGNICKVFHVMNKRLRESEYKSGRAYEPACNP